MFVVLELPTTRLGDLIEKRVNTFLLKENCPGNVTIRVVSSVDKQVEVKPGMRARFVLLIIIYTCIFSGANDGLLN